MNEIGAPRPQKIDREQEGRLLASYLPLLAELEKNGVEYCVVGGTGVCVHQYAAGDGSYRATRDMDILVPGTYTNADFGRDYTEAYGGDDREAVEAIVRENGISGSPEPDDDPEELAYMNMSFVGAAAEDGFGIETPDFDVCRYLNERTALSIGKEQVEIAGIRVWVATIDELIAMKKSTIAMTRDDPANPRRPQDFIDLGTLDRLKAKRDADRESGREALERKPGCLAKIAGILPGRKTDPR